MYAKEWEEIPFLAVQLRGLSYVWRHERDKVHSGTCVVVGHRSEGVLAHGLCLSGACTVVPTKHWSCVLKSIGFWFVTVFSLLEHSGFMENLSFSCNPFFPVLKQKINFYHIFFHLHFSMLIPWWNLCGGQNPAPVNIVNVSVFVLERSLEPSWW